MTGYFDVPPLRYTGSKWQLASWIIDQMPPHLTYVEPFCGGAAVFFRKPVSKVEILNDIDGSVVNFFEVLRARPDELINAIELTPYAREEYERAYEGSEDPLEWARRFYVMTRMSFGASPVQKSGWRTQRNWNRGTSITGEWKRIAGLWLAVERLKDALIECLPAQDVILNYDTPETLFYLDPPYVMTSRSQGVGRKRYMFEMSDDDHRQLAETLHQVKGMVLLSGYHSGLYSELYSDWSVTTHTNTTNGNGTATEYLWCSPNTTRIDRLPLFAQEVAP